MDLGDHRGKGAGSGARVVPRRVAVAAAMTAMMIADTEKESGGDRQTYGGMMVQTMGVGKKT
jgi:hypothetical protein